jgi:hypothetical protein
MAGSCVHSVDLHSPYNTGNFLTDSVTTSFCRSTVLQMMQIIQGSKTQIENLKRLCQFKSTYFRYINLTPKIIKITIHQKLWNWDLIYISTVVCCDMVFQKCVLTFIESIEHLFCWQMFHHSQLWNHKNSQLHGLSVHCQMQLWIQFTYVPWRILVS